MIDDRAALEERIGTEFRNLALLEQALTHESYTHEHGLESSNERLEFLGDAVLGLVISSYLFETYPERREGDLTRMKSQAVSSDFLSLRAREVDLGKFLILGKGEEASGGRNRPSVLADALEALVGAIFLDRGFEAARDFVLLVFGAHLADLNFVGKDFKGELQERTQKHFRGLPVYTVVDEEGPPHNKSFSVRVNFGDTKLGEGTGASKKHAEQAAAREGLTNFQALLDSHLPDAAPGSLDPPMLPDQRGNQGATKELPGDNGSPGL